MTNGNTRVFSNGPHCWYAMWQSQMARTTFNSKGAALAWIAVCDSKGTFHS